MRGLRSLFRRRADDAELDEEIREHLRLAADEYVAGGMSREDAERAARRDFGGVDQVRERHRDARGFRWVDALVRDVRFGVRSLLKRPTFTSVAVASLAIGIGANAAIFSLVDTVVLEGVPYERPEELVDVYESGEEAFAAVPLAYPNFEDVRDGAGDAFEGVVASWWVPAQIGTGSGEIVPGFAEVVTGDYFPLLGLRAEIGRTLLPEDDIVVGGHPVVVLGYDFWRESMGGDPGVLGRELRVNGRAYTVVGVAEEGYDGGIRGMEAELFAPMSMADVLFGSDMRTSRVQKSLYVRARLAEGVTFTEARSAVARVAAELEASSPAGWTPGAGFTLMPTTDVVLFPDFDPFVRAVAWVLMGAVGLVLLLACTNLASFLLARALDRRREIAMRLALGASRGDLIRQLLVESLLLGAASGLAGLGVAWVLIRGIDGYPFPISWPIGLDLGLDGRVLAFTAAISLGAGLVLGLLPALQGTRGLTLSSTLRSERSTGAAGPQVRWRSALVGAQLTISLVLLFGAGLAFRSLQQARDADPGFGREPTALLSVITPNTRFTRDEANRYSDRLRDRFLGLPGVEAVGRSDMLPLGTTWSNVSVTIPGHEPPAGQEWFEIPRMQVDDHFLDAVGIPLLDGRGFDERDRSEGERVAIVSEAMARRFWPEDGAVGRTIVDAREAEGADGLDASDREIRIVGVAADIKVRTLGEDPRPLVYLPLGRDDVLGTAFLARTSGSAERTRLAMVDAGLEVDPDLWIYSNRTLEEYLAVQTLPWRITSAMLAVFGVLALALASIGLYGVVSYVVTSRTGEVGVRLAMGADASGIVRLLFRGGVKLLAVGSVVGLAFALVLGRLVDGLLFGVSGLDVPVLLGAWLALMAIGSLAVWIPARRASRLDPVRALRME